MIAHILIREVNEEIICEVERRMRIILTYFDRFDKHFGNNNILEIKENMLKEITEVHEIEEDDMDFQFTNGTLQIGTLDEIGDVGDTSICKDTNTIERKKEGDKTPSWITSSNFMCLLNLPNSMRKF